MTKATKNIVIGLGVLIVSLVVIFSSTTKASGGLLGADEFITKYQSAPGAVLLDVRTPGEFVAGHIATAINVDYENPNFVEELKKLDPTKTYFIYCRSGNRSSKALVLMKQNNFQMVYDLRGGVSGSPQLLK
ncbi:MAG: rhodanese-like domain-containing protein [Candidatus Pacebacteria bacterium]|jgi:rhodanese-related sulfurtransferase|nr:rhodanese-like domain-containing protein [Candidatus Paceibacterota bacterium]